LKMQASGDDDIVFRVKDQSDRDGLSYWIIRCCSRLAKHGKWQ